jgi:hypothetical protein
MAILDSQLPEDFMPQATSDLSEKLELQDIRTAFFDNFADNFMRFDETQDAYEKLMHCSTFCAMMGLKEPRHCKRIVKATCALSMCSFETDEVQAVLGYALININRKFEYVASLDAQQRADLATCHIYIAQAMLYDDFAAMPIFCAQIFKTQDTAPFFARVLTVMKFWKNRVVVTGEELAATSKMFSDCIE